MIKIVTNKLFFTGILAVYPINAPKPSDNNATAKNT